MKTKHLTVLLKVRFLLTVLLMAKCRPKVVLKEKYLLTGVLMVMHPLKVLHLLTDVMYFPLKVLYLL